MMLTALRTAAVRRPVEGSMRGRLIPWEGRENIEKVLIIVNIEFPNTYIYEATMVLKPHLSLVHYRLSLGKPCHFWSW